MANVLLFGATGQIGSRILREALDRNHNVTAVVRDSAERMEGSTSVEGNIFDLEQVKALLKNQDIIISAYGPGYENVSPLVDATHTLIEAVSGTDKRLIAVGGAGTLPLGDGLVMEADFFPAEWKPIAQAHLDALNLYRASQNLRWTNVSPAGLIEPGERTGDFRISSNFITDAEGNSRISMEDFAVAILDEVEKEDYVEARFTAAY